MFVLAAMAAAKGSSGSSETVAGGGGGGGGAACARVEAAASSSKSTESASADGAQIAPDDGQKKMELNINKKNAISSKSVDEHDEHFTRGDVGRNHFPLARDYPGIGESCAFVSSDKPNAGGRSALRVGG